MTTALAFGLSTRLRYGVWILPQLGFRVLVLGVAAGVTFFAAVVAVLGLGPTIGVPMAAALTVIFFAFRAIGLTVVGGFLGGVGPAPLVPPAVAVDARGLRRGRSPCWSCGSCRISAACCGVCARLLALGTGIVTLATTVSESEAAANLI